VALISAGFTGWQAVEANRANNEQQATQAGYVYFDFIARAGAAGEYSIVNRNQQPVTTVVYTYAIDGRDSGGDVYVGTIPGCSTVALTPQDDRIKKGRFEPVDLYFIDPNGESWKRDKGSRVTASKPRGRYDGKPRTVGVVTPIAAGCQATS
jgi:hypothetical protein